MSEEVEQNAKNDETVKKTGRGFLVITIAKLWFMVTGATIAIGLPIVFDSAELFGVFKIVTEAISLINMVMIAGTLQAVSKLVSEQPDRANSVVKTAMKFQLLLGVPIAGAYAIASPWIAASLNDPELTGLIRLSSLIVLFYAFYAIFVGYLNGLKEFVKQASLDITFATMKTIGIMGLVLLGFGVGGAVLGFVVAAGIICVLSGAWTAKLMLARPDTATDADPDAVRRLAKYLVWVMIYTFGLNVLMRADLFVLKSVVGDIPSHIAGADALFNVMSNKFSGFYGAVLNVARIPYQGVIAVTFVIFPLISSSTFEDDRETTRGYISTTFRYCLLLICGVAIVLALNADSIIGGLYSADYQAASSALGLLSVGIIFFAIFYVATTMIIGSGHPIAAAGIMGVSMSISAVLNYVMVRRVHADVMESMTYTAVPAPTGSGLDIVRGAVNIAQNDAAFAGSYLLRAPEYMEAAAVATTIAMALGCFGAIAWLWKKFDAVPPLLTVIRILFAAALMFGLDMLITLPIEWVAEMGKIKFLLLVVVKMAVIGLVFLIALAVTKEFNAADLQKVKTVLGRKKN